MKIKHTQSDNMLTNNSFRGRTLATIEDLSLDERLYLFKQTQQLKQAILSGDKQRQQEFRIDDPDFGIYEVFLENSTRTKESFKNACHFHRIKFSDFQGDSSSFSKGETYADAFNTLIGYDNYIFIVRSSEEGLCRWLEACGNEYAKRHNLDRTPSFINGGDGKHEHPTQELLDDFTFIEDNQGNTSNIHIALVGDLLHGRTVHSKANGLNIFSEVRVDLIAPSEFAMPSHYVSQMKKNGFELRQFESIEEYILNGQLADKWYFTRPQIERMGEDVRKRQEGLRKKITFSKELFKKYSNKLDEGTAFYHPLPRHDLHPTIPHFLDNTTLNHYERQSQNGKYTRIVLLGLIHGMLGNDFEGVSKGSDQSVLDDQFIDIVDFPKSSGKKEYAEGISPIRNGIVIDHICRGEDYESIQTHCYKIIDTLNLYGRGGQWADESKKESGTLKGLISRPNYRDLDKSEMRILAAIAPGSTINVIKDNIITRKYRLSVPPSIYGISQTSCKNDGCISSDQNQHVKPFFYKMDDRNLTCKYCEMPHSFKEIWKK